MNDREQEVRDDIENLNARMKKLEAAPQQPAVTLEYSRSNGLYRVVQIQGNKPVVVYTSERTARVGDWVDQSDANALGLVADLIVKPYRLVDA